MSNLPRVMLRAPLRVVAWMLLLLVGLAAPDVAPLADGVGSHDPPTRTAKERLGAKASDEQQVDNFGARRCPLVSPSCRSVPGSLSSERPLPGRAHLRASRPSGSPAGRDLATPLRPRRAMTETIPINVRLGWAMLSKK